MSYDDAMVLIHEVEEKAIRLGPGHADEWRDTLKKALDTHPSGIRFHFPRTLKPYQQELLGEINKIAPGSATLYDPRTPEG